MDKTVAAYDPSRPKVGVMPQEYTRPHLHILAELIIANEGSFWATVDGSKVLVSEGMGILVFPYQIHAYEPCDSKRATIILIHPDRNQTLSACLNQYLPENPLIPTEIVDEDVKGLCRLLEKHFSDDRYPYTQSVLESIGEVIFLLVMRRLKLTENKNTNYDTLKKILIWCSAHFDEPISEDMVGAQLYLSRSRISHLFSAQLGMSFRDYVNGLRVQTALELLVKTSKTVSEIALECGFGSFCSFNRVFKQFRGMTPTEYRKQHG